MTINLPKKFPRIETERLLLRPFAIDDAPVVQELAGDYDISANVRMIPHPYPEHMAEDWIDSHQDKLEHGEIHLAVTLRDDGNTLIGAIGLIVNRDDENAELGYWIGKPYWNNGYCTEAAQSLVKYGFDKLKLHRIHSFYMTKNPASGKVMQKLGMKYEGTLRKCINKWDVFEDVNIYSILISEYSG
ncbi:MAG: GNAT family N-acetyltransferase [Dehalococcoidia bacterium]|jgi:RimJ/RimL family protein N-acetyltransferase